MSTPPTNFKLTKDSITRRVGFPIRPPWDELAARISTVFDIPVGRVGVSYTDSDGDVVTLSTDQELQEYYLYTVTNPTQLLKFIVVDLGSLRDSFSNGQQPTSHPATPPETFFPSEQGQNRGMFGPEEEDYFDVGPEWRYPDVGQIHGMYPTDGARPSSQLSHGFIESVHSDTSHISKLASDLDSDNESDIVDLSGINLDKGKGRVELDDDVSSTSSVICDDSPAKYPVHVFDAASHRAHSEKAESTVRALSDSPQSTVVPIPQRSTPRPTVEDVADEESIRDASSVRTSSVRAPSVRASSVHASSVYSAPKSAPEEVPAAEESVPDPPVPDIEPREPSPETASPMFSRDMAAFLNTLRTTLLANPELSEGLRNIMSNARNGAYWAAHRESMSHAAQGIARQAQAAQVAAQEMHRSAEAEASRRVTEALGGLFRSFSAFASVDSNAAGQNAPNADENRNTGEEHDFWNPNNQFWTDFRHGHEQRGGSRHMSWGFPFTGYDHGHHGPGRWGSWSPDPFDTPHSRFNQRSSSPPPGGPRNHGHGQYPRFGPGRFRGYRTSFPPNEVGGSPSPIHHPRHPHPPRFDIPPPPPPPFAGPFPPPPHGRGPLLPPPPPPPPHGPPQPSTSDMMPPLSQKPTVQELRERVEIAKQMYQLEKARYRKDREERKRDRRINYEAETSAEARKPAVHVNVQSTPIQSPTVKIATAGLGRPASPASKPPTSADTSATPIPQVVPQASMPRGFHFQPNLGVVNVPRVSLPPRLSILKPAAVEPIPVASSSNPDKIPTGMNGRQKSIHRITKKLADMGFTESAFNNLPSRIQQQVGTTTPTSKDEEDNVVTNVLEELLSTTPETPSASVSGRKKGADDNSSIPGSWH